MIRLKALRLKGVNSASLAGPGATSITDKDAEMYFSPSDDYVAAKRRKGDCGEYLIPTSDVAYMQPMEPLDCFEKDVPVVTAPAQLEALAELSAVGQEIDNAITAAGGDTVRMVKIAGKIVERRGPPKDDELEALTAPKRSIFEPEDDEA